MRKKTKKLIVAFDTTAAAIALEQACAGREDMGRIIPTPRAVSAGCGLAWCAPPTREAALRSLLDSCGIPYASITFVDLY